MSNNQNNDQSEKSLNEMKDAEAHLALVHGDDGDDAPSEYAEEEYEELEDSEEDGSEDEELEEEEGGAGEPAEPEDENDGEDIWECCCQDENGDSIEHTDFSETCEKCHAKYCAECDEVFNTVEDPVCLHADAYSNIDYFDCDCSWGQHRADYVCPETGARCCRECQYVTVDDVCGVCAENERQALREAVTATEA